MTLFVCIRLFGLKDSTHLISYHIYLHQEGDILVIQFDPVSSWVHLVCCVTSQKTSYRIFIKILHQRCTYGYSWTVGSRPPLDPWYPVYYSTSTSYLLFFSGITDRVSILSQLYHIDSVKLQDLKMHAGQKCYRFVIVIIGIYPSITAIAEFVYTFCLRDINLIGCCWFHNAYKIIECLHKLGVM